MNRSRSRWAAGGTAVAWITLLTLSAAVSTTSASRTLRWTASPSVLQRGEADGIAVTEQGKLFLAPRLNRVGSEQLPGEPAQVWAMTADSAGNLYLGTGPDGRILKITPSGRESVLFSVDEPLVTALALSPEGDLLAGTAPGGLVYRVRTDGGGELWSDTGERYVWSLAVGRDGGVYAGTGEQGEILPINRSGSTEIFFDSDESHIVSLLPLADGGLLAGGAGRGLVYQIDRDGNALVLHDDALPEVVALAREPDGAVLAAFVAGPAQAERRPEVELRLPDGVQVGTTNENVGQLEETSGPKLRGVIKGLPSAPDDADRRQRGRLVRIAADGQIEELWRSVRDAPFCLLQEPGGRTLFGTGEPASLFAIDAGGDVALLSVLREAQVTGLVRAGRTVFLSTSNPAATYRLEDDTTDTGVFVSPPFDAGGPARWGSIRWHVAGTSGRTELYTRTGNSAEPDDTWSAWSPALDDPRGSRVVNPDGRYLQWRVRFSGSRRSPDRLSAVEVDYEPYNRPPEVRGFGTESTTGATSGATAFRWSFRDPDDDPVELVLEYRPAETTGAWSVAETLADEALVTRARGTSEDWQDRRLVWQTASLAEGPYELRAVASDEAANHPGAGRLVQVEPRLWLIVDRTPPVIEVSPSGGRTFEIVVSDAQSAIRGLEVVEGDRTRFRARPVDGVCDSPRETFRLELPAGGTTWSVRGTDAGGNASTSPLQP